MEARKIKLLIMVAYLFAAVMGMPLFFPCCSYNFVTVQGNGTNASITTIVQQPTGLKVFALQRGVEFLAIVLALILGIAAVFALRSHLATHPNSQIDKKSEKVILTQAIAIPFAYFSFTVVSVVALLNDPTDGGLGVRLTGALLTFVLGVNPWILLACNKYIRHRVKQIVGVQANQIIPLNNASPAVHQAPQQLFQMVQPPAWVQQEVVVSVVRR